MLGFLFAWNVVAVVLPLAQSPTPTPAPTAAPLPVVPTTPLVPGNHSTPNKTAAGPAKKMVGQPRLPLAPPVHPVPTTVSCPAPRRTVKPGETVYMTLDDGPSRESRKYLLQALAQIKEKITFYESSYNTCPQITGLTLDCDDAAKTTAIEEWAWTIKAGHMLAAHSDSHMYDPSTKLCNYLKMPTINNVPAKYAACGNDAVADMVRGAKRFQEAMELADDSLWETPDERALYEKQLRNMWTYARLPCSNVWRMGADYKFDMGWGPAPADEKKARLGVADALFDGKNECKKTDLQGKPWFTTGWDVEWHGHEVNAKDAQAEKCRMLGVIETEFSRGGRDPRRANAVVLLGHDYHYATPEKAAMFRDLIVELKLRGYAMDTIDNLKV